MEITESTDGEAHIVALDGHLDTVASQPLEDRLVQLIENGVRLLALDCTRLEYLNSSGLKAVLVTAKRIEPVGGKLVLFGLTPNVHMIFEMIGFTRIMNIVRSREEALRVLAPGDAAPA